MMAMSPVVAPKPTGTETPGTFEPTDETSLEIEQYINAHPVVLALRANPDFIESRFTLKIPEAQRVHNLTTGLLTGPGKIVVPPFTWNEKGGKSFVAISYLGPDLCG